MTDREYRLRLRIDAITDERDYYRDLAADRRKRMVRYYEQAREMAKSRDYWKRLAGARIKKRLAA